MAFIEKLLGRQQQTEDIEDFLNALDEEDEELYEDADAFVRPVVLNTEEDVSYVMEELKKGNFILLNIADLSRRNAIKLRDLITAIKEQVLQIDGDIARISQEKILITPSRVKIMKRKPK
ncbi:MAG: cell division protein SepF [Candidatus Diapherotrites archaeon]|nr:cell division protein SepF [Candidatus Diapherotrites archaeon]